MSAPNDGDQGWREPGEGAQPPPTEPRPGGPVPPPSGWSGPPAPGGPRPPEQGDGWGQLPTTPSWGAAPPQGPSGPGGPGGPGLPPGSYGQYGAATPGPGPGQGASQPGIVPLRPLTLGEIYDGAFRAIRANPLVMFGFAAVVVTVLVAVQAALTWTSYEQINAIVGQPAPTEADLEELYGTLISTLSGSLVAAAVSFVGTTILNGLLIHSVSQSVIGRTVSLGQVWALARPQLLRLLLLTLVIVLLVVLAMAICLAPGGVLIAAGVVDGGAILLLFGVLAAVPAVLVVVTGTVLATPTLVLERAGVLTALRRGWALTRPTFWRVLGIYLLTSILVSIVAVVITGPVAALGPSLGDATVQTVLQFVSTTVATAITTPIMAAVIALLYVDVRIRLEGLDVELAAAAAQED